MHSWIQEESDGWMKVKVPSDLAKASEEVEQKTKQHKQNQ